MSHGDHMRLGGGELEKLERWKMHLVDEFKEILEEIDALKTQRLADDSDARPRREGSGPSFSDGTELQETVAELINEVRKHEELVNEMRENAPPPKWFGPIERLILGTGNFLAPVLVEADRILDEAKCCQHPFNCRCQRQLKLYEERIAPALKEWGEFDAHAEVLRKKQSDF